MTNIAFKPWVGSKYKESRVRLLLVGDSFYGDPDPEPEQSALTVISKWKSGDWNIRYLVAAARVLTGKDRWDLERTKDLEHIAFYNFVQTSMPWSDVRPTSNEFRSSVLAFLEVIDMTDPTHILVTGKTVWSFLPSDGLIESVRFGQELMLLRSYKTPSGVAKATVIPHLSRYFSPLRWHGPVAAFQQT